MQEILEGIASTVLVRCPESQHNQPCHHMQAASAAAAALQAQGVHLLIATLVVWVKGAEACQACARSAGLLATRLASEMAANLPDRSSTAPRDHSSWKSGRRYDEDYKRELVEALPAKRKCSSSSAVGSLDGVDFATQARWELQDVLRHQTATWRMLHGASGVFIAQEDASRVGNPAKDTVYYTLSHATEAGCLGTVLLPQAISCTTYDGQGPTQIYTHVCNTSQQIPDPICTRVQ